MDKIVFSFAIAIGRRYYWSIVIILAILVVHRWICSKIYRSGQWLSLLIDTPAQSMTTGSDNWWTQYTQSIAMDDIHRWTGLLRTLLWINNVHWYEVRPVYIYTAVAPFLFHSFPFLQAVINSTFTHHLTHSSICPLLYGRKSTLRTYSYTYS